MGRVSTRHEVQRGPRFCNVAHPCGIQTVCVLDRVPAYHVDDEWRRDPARDEKETK